MKMMMANTRVSYCSSPPIARHQEPRQARIMGGEAGGNLAFAYPGQNPFQPVAYSTIRRVHYPPDSYMQTMATYATPVRQQQRGMTATAAAPPPEMIVQRDFRKISGISSEMFRQIEAVEKQYDTTTATLIEAVERRGEMIVRLIDPRVLGRGGVDAHNLYVTASTAGQTVQFVEIIKRPGQTLGLYIREGDGVTTTDGVFISRIEPQSPVYTSGVLKVGDEVLAVNLVDVRRMNLDDVVIVMSIPRRLVLTIRSRGSYRQSGVSPASTLQPTSYPDADNYHHTPVVVVKKDISHDQEAYDMEEVAIREQEARRLHEGMKSLNRGISIDDDGLMDRPSSRLSIIRPSSRNILRPMTHARDDTYVQIYQKAADARTRPYQRQNSSNLSRIYPRTLENLVEEDDDFHSGYVSDTLIATGGRKSATLSRMSGIHRASHGPRSGRYSSMSNTRYWDDDPRADPLLSRPGSALGILPTVSDDYLDRYSRPLSRLSLRSGTPTGLSAGMRHRRGLQDPSDALIRSSLSSHGLSRRRGGGHRPAPMLDGTASDSESHARSYLKNQSLLDRYSRLSASGRTSALSDRMRTSSLPRPPSYAGHRRHHMVPAVPSQSRLSGRLGYKPSASYDEDSDGATSAPENPLLDKERRHGLMSGRRRAASPPSGYSSNEYRQWMTRAPSTSALYDVVRRPGSRSGSRLGPSLPSGLSSHSLSKIAHSAESLLDTIRLEAQKNLLVDLYGNRGAVAAAAASAGRRSPASLLIDSMTDPRSSHHLKQQRLTASGRPGLRSGALSTTANNEYAARASAGPAVIPNPTPVRASDDSRMHLLTLNPREFFKYKYDKNSHQIMSADARDALHSSLSSATVDLHDSLTTPASLLASNPMDSTSAGPWSGMGFSGLLWIHLLAGRGLRATGPATATANGPVKQPASVGLNRDLYCVIECDRVHRARTVVRSGESSFDWDEVFELDIMDCKEVSFLLYSWDPESKHKLCYKGIVNLVSLSLSKTPVHSLALKMEPRGTLYIKMRYKEPAIAFQRPLPSPPTSSSGIFGVDVETVVKRENSGSKVPLILKRCVEEVEKRGLHVVGIHRLCGSAVRKKMLREAFEKNAWLVDLSVEHVPDINVITSEYSFLLPSLLLLVSRVSFYLSTRGAIIHSYLNTLVTQEPGISV